MVEIQWKSDKMESNSPIIRFEFYHSFSDIKKNMYMKITTVTWILTSIFWCDLVLTEFIDNFLWCGKMTKWQATNPQKKIIEFAFNFHKHFGEYVIKCGIPNGDRVFFLLLPSSKRLVPLHRFWRKWEFDIKDCDINLHIANFSHTDEMVFWAGNWKCAIDSCGLITPGHIQKSVLVAILAFVVVF